MTRRMFAVLGVVALLLAPAVVLADGGITPGPTMRLAGRHTFTAAPSSAGGPLTWTVDREETSERGSGSPTRRHAIDTATGASATFNLAKIAGQETVYYITARDHGFQDTLRVQVFPADRRASFHYTSAENPRVQVYLIVPSTLSPATRIVMVMHGSSRNADEYCDSWVGWGPRNDYLILCPRFDDAGWPNVRSYHLGNVFTGDDGAGDLNPESRWSFTVAEGIHDTARTGFGIAHESWDMWGHSAGGQFTHRFLLFKPAAKIRFAMPANPGWYTAPDLAIDYPYGVRHPLLSFMVPDLVDYTNKRLVIMRGTLDTGRGSGVRTTPEADAQGLNRYERAGYMYRKGGEINPSLSWQLLDVEGAGHDQTEMAPAAQAFLEAPAPPAAPAHLTATAVSSSRIDLSWTDNADNEVGFAIERSTNGSTFAWIATVGADATSYPSTGLAPGASHAYRVRAIHGAGDSDYSNIATATTPGAPLPAPSP